MTNSTDNLVLEHLRAIRQDIGDLKQAVREIRIEIISLRQQFHNMQGDTLPQVQGMAAVLTDVERIKTRLDFNDA